MEIHQQVKRCSGNESPIFILMNHNPAPEMKQLPLSVYETETHIFGGDEEDKVGADTFDPTLSSVDSFVALPFSLETSQTERIAVDQVSKQGNMDGVSMLEVQNTTLATAVKILEKKMECIVKALELMQQEPPETIDHTLLRRLRNICQQLPTIDTRDFASAFDKDMSDCLMTTYLAAATKTSSTLVEVSELYSTIFKEKSRSHY